MDLSFGSATADRAQVDRTYQLIESGQAEEALALIAPLSGRPDATHAALAAHSAALKVARRLDEAEAWDRRATERFPNSGVAWHNLGATLGDLGRTDEALAAIERAIALGQDGPETWMVAARANLDRLDYEAAKAAFGKALARRPIESGIAGELANLIWMTTADLDQAVAPLRAARAAGASDTSLFLDEGRLLKAAGRSRETIEFYDQALRLRPNDPELLYWATDAALAAGDVEKAWPLAERALAAAPNDLAILTGAASARLAVGRADEAFDVAVRATRVAPQDQPGWAWLATAGRATGHPIHQALFDYGALVRTYRIETPPGWPDLATFLADLAQTLRAMHQFKVEPPVQSLRGGTQTGGDLSTVDDPVLKAFFAALDAPIRSYMAEVSTGRDPLRSRNTGRYRMSSAWSVLLKANGFHVSHFHPMGWISSAFYVETPSAPEPQGWLKFGEPPFPTVPKMGPEHMIRPEPGLLALFPSYMWHGTVPFSTDETRMTIAFDVVPD